jgi:transcriptional regulator with XRE-family HTH domain
MKLTDYMKRHKIDRYQFAEMIGVDRVSVYRWETGKAFPIRHLEKIVAATKGKVTANDFTQPKGATQS